MYSDRQLEEEVLTDFWFNHFNRIFLNKGADRYLVYAAYERDGHPPTRPGEVLRTLLAATAKSPAAVLFYLDNWQSEGPDSDAALGRPEHALRAQVALAELLGPMAH